MTVAAVVPVVLLGPQRLRPTLIDAVRSLGIPDDAPIATVTAGWQEREPDDRELAEHLGGRSTNLALYRRADAVLRQDPELAAVYHRRQEILRRLQALYALRLRHAMAACDALMREPGDDGGLLDARSDAIESVRALDERHLDAVRDVHAHFEELARPLERPALAREREELTRIVEGSGAVAIAGGHVAVLLNRLELFGLGPALATRPLIAWSAGAMAVSERVVLFHDRPPHGPGWAEVLERGLGLARGVVTFPHARRRLDLENQTRVALAARRFAPALCLALDDGAGARDLGSGWTAAPEARRLADGGLVEAWAA